MRSWSWIFGFLGGLAVLGFLAYAGLVDSIEPPYAVAGGLGAAMIGAWLWLDRENLGVWGKGPSVQAMYRERDESKPAD